MEFSVELLSVNGDDDGVIFEYGIECIEDGFDDVIEIGSFIVWYELCGILFSFESLWSFEDGGDVDFNGYIDVCIWEVFLYECFVIFGACGSVSASELCDSGSGFGNGLPRNGDVYDFHCRMPHRWDWFCG